MHFGGCGFIDTCRSCSDPVIIFNFQQIEGDSDSHSNHSNYTKCKLEMGLLWQYSHAKDFFIAHS